MHPTIDFTGCVHVMRHLDRPEEYICRVEPGPHGERHFLIAYTRLDAADAALRRMGMVEWCEITTGVLGHLMLQPNDHALRWAGVYLDLSLEQIDRIIAPHQRQRRR